MLLFLGSCKIIQLTKNKNVENLVANNKSVKFEFDKQILLETKFCSGETKKLAFDLGAGTTILFKKSGLEYLEKITPTLAYGHSISADKKKIKNNFYKMGVLQTDAFKLTNSFLPVVPNFQTSLCKNIVGVWGADTFEGKILILKMEDSTLTVLDSLPSLDNWIPVETTYKYPHFYVILKIGGKKIKLLLDTGSTSGIVISQDTYKEKNLENETPLFDVSKWTGQAFSTASGLTEPDTIIKGVLSEASWGDYKIDSIPIYINNRIKRSVIGLDVLKRLNILFDFHNHDIYIQKNPNSINLTLKSFFGRKGFSINNSKTNVWTVSVLQVNSPASRAGLKVGDQIISINGITPDQSNMCEYIKIISELDGSLTNYEAIILRNNNRIQITL